MCFYMHTITQITQYIKHASALTGMTFICIYIAQIHVVDWRCQCLIVVWCERGHVCACLFEAIPFPWLRVRERAWGLVRAR